MVGGGAQNVLGYVILTRSPELLATLKREGGGEENNIPTFKRAGVIGFTLA